MCIYSLLHIKIPRKTNFECAIESKKQQQPKYEAKNQKKHDVMIC